MSTAAPLHVHVAISQVMGKLAKEGIAKKGTNQQQGYKFRGIDDVYNALSAELAEAKLLMLPYALERTVTERETKGGGISYNVCLDVQFALISAVDSSRELVKQFGEASDSGDKATNKAASAAYKYAAIQVFAIPTVGDNDADANTPEETKKSSRGSQPASGGVTTQKTAASTSSQKATSSSTSSSSSNGPKPLALTKEEQKAFLADVETRGWDKEDIRKYALTHGLNHSTLAAAKEFFKGTKANGQTETSSQASNNTAGVASAS